MNMSKDLFIFGSADLSSTLIRHGLIDEYRLGLTPVVLGGGNPLFKPWPGQAENEALGGKAAEVRLRDPSLRADGLIIAP